MSHLRFVVLLLAALTLTIHAPGAVALLGDSASADVLVGMEPGLEDEAILAIGLAGGTIRDVERDLGIARVEVADLEAFSDALALDPSISWIETNGRVVMTGSQWNGSQWNTLDWDGSQWNGDDDVAPSTTDDPGAQWGLLASNVPAAWDVTTGSGHAKLCVLDSGVDLDHRDLAANVQGTGFNAVEPGATADDDAGHGTHVAGLAAAAVGNGWGIAGIGNVRILPAKVLDADGSGTEADLAWGLAWCARQGADVGLMALSASEPGPALDRAVEHAAATGMVLVASSGNGACDDCVSYPARHPDVLAVSAIDESGGLAPFSSLGDEVDLAAPGVDVLSTFPSDRFAYGSGTSQAAAHAAGVAALMRDADPSMGAREVRDALRSSAQPTVQGVDALDAGGAMGAP